MRQLLLLTLVLLSGCVSLLPPDNQAITSVNPGDGYRIASPVRKPVGEHQVILAFSGGGTRAAALSYGVLQELRDTQIVDNGKPERLLDEVDLISSVSGGSFTAAYYGLYGDDIFRNYESDFLRKSVQSALVDKLLSPGYWFRSMFSGINRTTMATEYYDNEIFRGSTFADIPLDKRPFIEINATDLSTGAHVSFTQGFFDVLCTDLSTFPVAKAVTASSGVPIAFPPVTLKNHAGECNISDSYLAPILSRTQYDGPREQELIAALNRYLDASQRPYIHLVDGGVSDNLGLRAVIDRNELLNKNLDDLLHHSSVKDVLVILVNAEVKSKTSLDESYQSPSMVKTAGVLTDVLISRFTVETRSLVKEQMKAIEKQAQAEGHDVRFYFVEVDFSSIASPSVKAYFNNLPTTLELSNEEIDNLINAGRQLLQKSGPYQQFLDRNRGQRLASAPAAKPCTVQDPLGCWFD